jgi:hypothetical protein
MMMANHRWVSALLALGLGCGVVTTAAACGSATSSTAAATASPSGSHALKAALPGVISCLDAHGMSVPTGATAQQVETALIALPAAQRKSDFDTCKSLMPANISQRLSQLSAGGSASPSAG